MCCSRELAAAERERRGEPQQLPGRSPAVDPGLDRLAELVERISRRAREKLDGRPRGVDQRVRPGLARTDDVRAAEGRERRPDWLRLDGQREDVAARLPIRLS